MNIKLQFKMSKICSVAGMIVGLCFSNCIISCDSSANNQDDSRRERYTINPEVYTDGLKISQYSVDSICSLNIPDGIVKMAVDKISVINGTFFILDNIISKKLYIFDYKGNLKTTIGERGHARGEFIGKPDEFFVDSHNKLHVFDKIGHKIIVYNEDGSVDDVVETNDLYPYSFGLTSNDKYIMYFGDGYRDKSNKKEKETRFSLLLFDKDYKNKKTMMLTSEKIHCFITSHTFFQDTDRVSFIPPFSDSVIVFKDDAIEKVVQFDFGGKNLIKEQPDALKQNKYPFMENYKGVLGITRYQETASLVFLQYMYHDYPYYWLFDKRTGQSVNGLSIFEGISPYTYYHLDGNQIIAYVDDNVVELFKKYYHNKANKLQDGLKKSPVYMKDLMERRIKVPALVYMTLK